MIDAKKFGKQLSYLRRKAHLKQHDIAKKCFISVQAVSKWERGQCSPNILMLDDLASVLGVEIKDLFEDEQHREIDK